MAERFEAVLVGFWPDLSEYFLIYKKKKRWRLGWCARMKYSELWRKRSIYDWDVRLDGLYGVENVKQATQYTLVFPVSHKILIFQGFPAIVFYQRKTVFA